MKAHTDKSAACIGLGVVASAMAIGAPGCGGRALTETESATTISAALTQSSSPPGGLAVSQVPQFVAVTFDDNFQIDGFNWAINFLGPLHNPAGTNNAATYDNTSVRTSFYHNSTYLSGMQSAWQTAFNAGHELDDHTVDHPDGIGFTQSQWATEIHNCRTALANAMGTTVSNIIGFRAPYLHYNDSTFSALLAESPAFTYDTSIMGCWATAAGPTSCPWPYTMDSGSPDADAVFSKWSGRNVVSVGPHAGLWEMPVSVVFVPPDSVATQYGFPTGFRQRVQNLIGGAQNPNFFEQSTGKMVGMDITMVLDAKMSKAEALATLKYTLDQRLAGNRAPMIFVGHTHVYEAGWNVNAPNVSDLTQRRGIIQDFVNYALSKPDVRIRPVADILTWMKTPVPLGACTSETNAAFCSRLGKNCGAVTANDNCGVSRTVTSCGTCTSPQTCGGAGAANICGGGGPTSLAPIADSYVRDNTYAGTNFGTATSIFAKQTTGAGFTRRSFLKFDLSGVSSSSLTKATLQVTVTAVDAPPGPVKVYSVTDDSWTETGITWNNQPAKVTLLSSASASGAGVVNLDVTSFINSQIAGDRTASLVLVDDTNANVLVTINSREAASGKPVLSLTP